MSLKEVAVIDRHDREIVKLFAPQLSVKLRREMDGERDLTAYDFSNEAVELEFEDGSKVLFNYAFIVEGDTGYGVFTEHCGYYCIYEPSIVEVKIIYPDKRKKPKYLKKKEPD